LSTVKSTSSFRVLGELLMKKHLIAAAVAAAVAVPAMAQNVTVYGIMGLGYSSVKAEIGNLSSETTTTGAAAQQSASRVGFRGTEDLGGGLKAGFVYEIGVSNDNATSVFGNTRLAYVDLTGGFGTGRFGKVDSITRQIYNNFTAHGNTSFAPGNVLGGSFGGGTGTGVFATPIAALTTAANALSAGAEKDAALAGVATLTSVAGAAGAGSTRVVDSIGYISPNMSGFQFQVQYGQTETKSEILNSAATDTLKGNAKTSSLNLGVTYSSGPLSVALGQDRVTTESKAAATFPATTDNKFTTNMLGATYDLGVAKVFGLITRKTLDLNVESSASLAYDGEFKVKDTTVGVTVPFGVTTLVASYTDGELEGSDYSGYQLQANYALSKRTKVKNLIDDADLKQKGATVGLQHNF
jgi:predicted porin